MRGNRVAVRQQTGESVDAIVLLREDPKTVEKLFKAFEKSGDEDTALKSMDASDERFSAKMNVVMEQVRHHVEEEEKDWFPDVRKAMGRNRLQELGAQLEEAKGHAPRDPLTVPSAVS
ncbi:hypothetical protein [Streptomyces virginiae]|uniref:hypothetical protein n=1 Tax=Streptomyces virginiae TaxID=1961 RepID=UPI0034530F8A